MMSKPRRKAKPTSDLIDKSLLGTNFVIAVVAGAALLVSILTFFAIAEALGVKPSRLLSKVESELSE